MGPTTDEERRIRSYLTTQGAKLSPPQIVAKVRDAMAEVRAAAVAVPAARFATNSHVTARRSSPVSSPPTRPRAWTRRSR